MMGHTDAQDATRPRIGRREVIARLCGGAALAMAWPRNARAQRPMPVVGFLISASPNGPYPKAVAGVRDGLKSTGFVEGKSVAIESRWANGQYDLLPTLAADLVHRKVSAIFSTGSIVSALAAKAATSTIPIVFANGSDPVKFGLVESLARPGGNATGVTFYNDALVQKRLELLREMLPQVSTVAVIVNPKNQNAEPDVANVHAAGKILGLRIVPINVTGESEFAPAFNQIKAAGADALIVTTDAVFQARTEELAAEALRVRIPTMWGSKTQTGGGGLISYGTDISEMYRVAGTYVGHILKGEKPADMPVLQPTRFQLIVNLKTAKAIGLTIPESFLIRADEVIE
jgi:putative ABC transport system substrate-binding protein